MFQDGIIAGLRAGPETAKVSGECPNKLQLVLLQYILQASQSKSGPTLWFDFTLVVLCLCSLTKLETTAEHKYRESLDYINSFTLTQSSRDYTSALGEQQNVQVLKYKNKIFFFLLK